MGKWSYTRGADRGNKLGPKKWGAPSAQKNRQRVLNAIKRQRQQTAEREAAVVITAGMNRDGTLKVHSFKSAAEAHKAGFTWAGRPSSV